MKKYFMLLSIFVLIDSNLKAQEEALTQKVVKWYKETRFQIVDADANKEISKSEMEKFPDDFVFFLQNDNFSVADLDKDGVLDKDELEKKWDGEDRLRTIFENKDIRKLNEAYQRLPVADLNYLKSNPELLVALMKNFTWMTSHPFFTQSILQNKGLLKKNPDIYIAASKNLLWLAYNPYVAQKLYASPLAKTLLPELQSWRKSHNEFISDTPQLRNSSFNIEAKE